MTNSGKFGQVRDMIPQPEWVHTLAYQLWAWTCSQNVSRVWEIMRDGTYRDDGGIVPDDAYDGDDLPKITITRQTVSGWKQREDWPSRRIQDLRDLAPALHQQVAGNIMAASLTASEFLVEYLAGNRDTDDAVKAKQLDSRAKVAQDILNRSGHLAHSNPNSHVKPTGPQADHANAIAGKSREDLLALVMGTKRTDRTLGPSTVQAGNEPVIEVATPLAHPHHDPKPPRDPHPRSSNP